VGKGKRQRALTLRPLPEAAAANASSGEGRRLAAALLGCKCVPQTAYFSFLS
jgi:hypothetical protein